MTKRKLSLRRLFSNTKFLIIFSIAVAIIFWIVVALEYAPIVENVIEGVPVSIDMENSVPDKLGLQIFGQKDYTVDITVKGNRYVVGGNLLTTDDFDVTAQTAYVDSSGNHSLQLKVTMKDANADYEIVNTSAEYIEVYFDKYEEKEFEVTPRINTKLKEFTDNNYLFSKDDIILSTSTVTLSGAQTEMNKITAVYADVEVSSKLTESVTYDSTLVLYNGTGGDAKYISINGESSMKIPVTLPVYKIMTLPVSVSFKNSPSAYLNSPLSYTCNPSSTKVAVLQNGGASDKTVEVGSIDFSSLSPTHNVFTFNSSDLKDIKVLDGTVSYKVTVNVEDISSSSLTLNKSNITISGIENTSSVNVDISNTGNISIAGNKNSINSLSASELYGKIDLTNITLSDGDNRIAMTVFLKDSTDCWVTGTYYAVVTK